VKGVFGAIAGFFRRKPIVKEASKLDKDIEKELKNEKSFLRRAGLFLLRLLLGAQTILYAVGLSAADIANSLTRKNESIELVEGEFNALRIIHEQTIKEADGFIAQTAKSVSYRVYENLKIFGKRFPVIVFLAAVGAVVYGSLLVLLTKLAVKLTRLPEKVVKRINEADMMKLQWWFNLLKNIMTALPAGFARSIKGLGLTLKQIGDKLLKRGAKKEGATSLRELLGCTTKEALNPLSAVAKFLEKIVNTVVNMVLLKPVVALLGLTGAVLIIVVAGAAAFNREGENPNVETSEIKKLASNAKNPAARTLTAVAGKFAEKAVKTFGGLSKALSVLFGVKPS
jgi:hypothetical protein